VVSGLLGCYAASLVFGCRRLETTTTCRNVGNQISSDAASHNRRTDAPFTVPLGMFCLLKIRNLGIEAKLRLYFACFMTAKLGLKRYTHERNRERVLPRRDARNTTVVTGDYTEVHKFYSLKM